ncbi:hypothetical protein PPL_11988 [Heterostelium album PN500]|uniref:Uncharacterized protein n=1 Tax=Heterostelium pallidum (strain ATCC 26659 / Pp 5 / PN500) TaxID=670386 RepID=D3BV16_HETP5|nr:hypothetical protein PPL_11988 [Heterostelium album PN500]EFA74954.1 hypothetical protein PPL_11988 [Heterostelium album PN500]|eukprot:XP_020427088.1 hypothetical protein PPL_11988 [Heterostelium album PN500]
MGSLISTAYDRSLSLTLKGGNRPNMEKLNPILISKYFVNLQSGKNLYITGFLVSFLLGVRLLRNVFSKQMNLKGKLAIVTGASSGIGLSIATELASKGATVCLVARSKDKLSVIVEDLKSKGFEAFYICADLSKPADVTQCHQAVMQTIGNRPVDILVNCAGAGHWKFIEETSMEECNEMMALPYFAAFYMTRLFIPRMLSLNSGYIINVNSPASSNPWPGCIGYACSRYAMRGFTDALRMDLRGTNVQVMEVIAGETNSNYFEANGIDESHFPYLAQWLPKISPSDVAKSTVSGIINNKSRVVTPSSLGFVIRMGQLFPNFTTLFVARSPRGDQRIQNILKSAENSKTKQE